MPLCRASMSGSPSASQSIVTDCACTFCFRVDPDTPGQSVKYIVKMLAIEGVMRGVDSFAKKNPLWAGQQKGHARSDAWRGKWLVEVSQLRRDDWPQPSGQAGPRPGLPSSPPSTRSE